eukprot:IDg19245t1
MLVESRTVSAESARASEHVPDVPRQATCAPVTCRLGAHAAHAEIGRAQPALHCVVTHSNTPYDSAVRARCCSCLRAVCYYMCRLRLDALTGTQTRGADWRRVKKIAATGCVRSRMLCHHN